MKITLVISTLQCGGAERVASALANEWASAGYAVSVVTFEEKGAVPFYKLNGSVKLVNLGLNAPGRSLFGKLSFNLKKLSALRAALRELSPGLVIAFMGQTNVTALIAALGTGIPVIITEHADIRSCPPGGAVWKTLSLLLYPFAAALVAVSQGVLKSFPAYIRKKGVVINNPVAECFVSAAGTESAREKLIIGMGRLSREKGFDLLLKAFGKASASDPEWRLEIWGEGPERGALEALIRELGLEGRAKLPGATAEPEKQYARAGIFALPSRYEGLGIALCEAMACGVPAVSFDCPCGPGEIISNGTDGILVPPEDTQALASALERLMKDEAARGRIGGKAREIGRKFSIKAVMARWDGLIRGVPGGRAGKEKSF